MKILAAVWAVAVTATAGNITITVDGQASPREIYGASRLRKVFESTDFHAPDGASVIAAVRTSTLLANDPDLPRFEDAAPESGESEARGSGVIRRAS